jgi:hypothetical protein
MDTLSSIPFRTIPVVAGGSAATAIDLTSDDEKEEVLVHRPDLQSLRYPASPVAGVVDARQMRSSRLHTSASMPVLNEPTLGRRQLLRRQKAKSSGPDLKEIRSHHGLTFWKNKYFLRAGYC